MLNNKRKCVIHEISWIKHVSRLVLSCDLLEDRRLNDMTINYFLLCYHTKKDFMMPWVCTAIDRRRRQNVARTSPSAAPLVPLFCSYHNLALSVIYCWTDPRHLLIYLWNGVQILCACLIFYLRIRLSFFFNPQLSRMMGLDAIARKRNWHIQVCSKRRHGKCQTRT